MVGVVFYAFPAVTLAIWKDEWMRGISPVVGLWLGWQRLFVVSAMLPVPACVLTTEGESQISTRLLNN